MLAAAGLLIATAFLTEPALAIARRRRPARPAAADAHIVLADYERLVVTHSSQDGTVYVLRPPGADPHAILLAARLVLAQDRYEELSATSASPPTGPENDAASPQERPSPWARAGRRPERRLEGAAGSAALPAGRRDGPAPEGLHQRRHVPSILGRELVDAGDQQLPLLIAGARATRPLGGLVVVVHSGRLGGGGADRRDRHLEPLGEPVDRGGPRRSTRFRVVARVYTVDRGSPPRRATSP